MASVIKFLLCNVVVGWMIIRGLWWLNLVSGAKERSRPLDPDTLKTSQLKDIIEQRGINYDPMLTKPALTSLVLQNGGLVKADLETISDASINISQAIKSAKVFEDSYTRHKVLMHEGPSVWLVFCGSDWKTRVLESKTWEMFLQKLTNHGICFAFQESLTDCGIILRQQWIERSTDLPLGKYSEYTNSPRPREVLLWIFRVLSNETVSTPAFDKNIIKTEIGVFVRSFHPSPLSIAVLASEFKETATFFWTDDPRLNRTAMLVVVRGDVYHLRLREKWFLNQSELRLLLNLLMLQVQEFSLLLIVVCLIGWLVARDLIEAGYGNMTRGPLWYLVVFILAVLMEAYHIVAGVALLLTKVTPAETAGGTSLTPLIVVFNMIGKFGITGAFGIVFLYATEIFPTTLRSQAMGIASLCGRLGNLMATYTAYVYEKVPWLPGPLFGIMSVAAGLLVLLLPETLNRPLPQTIEDIEQWCADKQKPDDKRSEERRGAATGRERQIRKQSSLDLYFVNLQCMTI